MLGKETIDTNTYGRSSGRGGSYTTNYQMSGRELMTPDEVRMLDNSYALLFIRGERPVKDLKYNLLKHPNLILSADGNAEPYVHGQVRDAKASVEILGIRQLEADERAEIRGSVHGSANALAENSQENSAEQIPYELLSEEEVLNSYNSEKTESTRTKLVPVKRYTN